MGVQNVGPVGFSVDCCVEVNDAGSPVGGVAPYVVSINSLNGIITLGNTGAITWTAEGNTLYADLAAGAGLGSVTSVALASNNSNLSVVSGSPITTLGTITLGLAGNLSSISAAVMAADTILYATGAATFTTTTLTSFARTLIDDANAAAARTTLGLVIGTNVQAWSADLDSFVSTTSYSGSNPTFTGTITAAGFSGPMATGGNDLNLGGGSILNGDSGTFSGDLTAGNLIGAGAAITTLNASNVSSGTLAVARGGTNISSYAVGDLIYASGTTTLAKLADVSQGAFLRSGGVGVAPAWSGYVLPTTLVTGDVLYASSATIVNRLADVATGNALISGGVATAPSWGKITTSHTTGIAASGSNADITGFTLGVNFVDAVTFQGTVSLAAELLDSVASPGNSSDILTSTGTGTQWSTQISLDTLYIGTSLSLEGTITGAGTTGNQTINKPSGTVRIAAAGTSVIVTNSLCSTSSRVSAWCSTNDATAYVKNTVTTSGSFTINLGAAATAEVEISWELFNIA